MNTQTLSPSRAGLAKDLAALVKLRLSTIVVMSAALGYLLAAGSGVFLWSDFILLILGGLLVTGAANALNEVIERDTDVLMTRTANRPLPTGRMSMAAALLVAGIMGVGGVALLWWAFHPLAALLGALSLLSYAFIYTPMKRISPVAVFIGAIPGAIPPVIGYVAVTGFIGPEALALFAIQFFWQFPHFWAIAWLAREDYAKAGFDLLPDASGRTKATAIHIIIYTAVLLPVGLLPFWLGMSGWISAIAVTVCGLGFTFQAIRLYQTCDLKEARSLLFGSFAYLPLVLLALVLDKIV